MDKYGYIGIETLLNFCENSKDHSVTPNDFMRMKRVRMPEGRKGRKINQHSYPEKWLCSECGAKHFDFSDKFCSECGVNVEEGE